MPTVQPSAPPQEEFVYVQTGAPSYYGGEPTLPPMPQGGLYPNPYDPALNQPAPSAPGFGE